MRPALLLCLVSFCPSLLAQLSYDKPELVARANFTNSFNLPIGAFFANTTIRLNDTGGIAFPLGVLPGTTAKGVWHGKGTTGSLAFTGPVDAFLSGVGISNSDIVVFTLTDADPNGIYRWDPIDGDAFVTNLPLGASGWGTAQVNDDGAVGYRAGFIGGNAYTLFDGTAEILATEAGIDPGSPFSFLFTPSMNQSGHIAGKVRLGEAGDFGEGQPDQIRIFMPGGTSKLVAADTDDGPSQFTGFDNSVSLTDGGKVAFTTTLTGGERAVCLFDDPDIVFIARESDPMISEIEFFAPAANDSGLVAFRAFDATGFRAVWVGDGTNLTIVAREHDVVETDLGQGRIDQHDGSPVFGGGVDIDATGRVSFAAGLTPVDNDQIEWGSGAFTADFSGGPQPLTASLTAAPAARGLGGTGPGDLIAYTATIENPSGNDTAMSLSFNASPDPRSTHVTGSVTTGQGTVGSGNGDGDDDIEVALGDLAAGQSVQIGFLAMVFDPFPPGATEVAVQGLLSGVSVNLLTDDPSTGTEGDPTVTAVTVPDDNDLRYLREAWSTTDPFVPDTNGNDALDLLEILAILFP